MNSVCSIRIARLAPAPLAQRQREAGTRIAAAKPRVRRTVEWRVRAEDGKNSLNNLDKVLNAGAEASAPKAEEPAPPKKDPSGMSKEMRKKLRAEYEGWGGSEKKAMSSNFFVNIMVAISAMAIVAKVTGILP